MANVYAVIEYLPIGAAGAGAGGEAVLSEHPTWDGAVAAKQTLYNRRPELVGCLTVRAQAARLPVEKEAGDAEGGDVGGGAGAPAGAGGVDAEPVGDRLVEHGGAAERPLPRPSRGVARGAGPAEPATA